MPRKKNLPWPRRKQAGQSIATIYRINIKGVVWYQVRWTEAGCVKRQTFSNDENADSFAQEKADQLNAGELGVLTLTPDEAAAYRHALKACDGIPIDAVCREWSEAKSRLGTTLLLHAVDEYVCRHMGKSLSLNDAVDCFMESVADKSDVYTSRLKARLEHVKKAFGARPLRGITEQEIRAFVNGRGGADRTWNNNRDAIVSVWRWARQEGYLPRDMQTEAERVVAKEIKRKKRIAIFTPEEMRRLLSAAPAHTVPLLAISGFGGVRSQGELARLKWEDVKWDRNVIDVEGKTGECRYVPMHENLRAWLLPYKEKRGKVATIKADKAFLRAAKGAKIQWRHNALRHSFGSYRCAECKSVEQTAFEMGNSATVVKRCYKERVHEDEALEWFAIMPKKRNRKGR